MKLFDRDENMKSIGCIVRFFIISVVIIWGIIGLFYVIAFILAFMGISLPDFI